MRLVSCGVCNGLTWIHLKKMCTWVSSKVWQKEPRTAFVIPKAWSFLLRKSTLNWKERKVVLIVAKLSDE